MNPEESTTTPLLQNPDTNGHVSSNLPSEEMEKVLENKRAVPIRWWTKLVIWESKTLWQLSWASIIVQVFNYMLSFATLTFVGHLNALELAGASVTNVGIQGLAYGIMVYNSNSLFFSFSFLWVSFFYKQIFNTSGI